MSDAGHWSDLAPRVMSGVVMAAVGGVDLWLGGWPFFALVAALCGLMIWEGARMFGASTPRWLGILGVVALLLAWVLPWWAVMPILIGASLAGGGQAGHDKGLFVGFFAWIMLASFALLLLRQEAGLMWMIWLVLVVIMSDVSGYFAGRGLGGPKFWPSISPKKTWSGTVAGWICAAILGALFAGPLEAGPALILVSVVVAFCGQMGDIAVSAIKRRMGVKDSSNLIPGHGGVLDRFDAMMGAAAATIILWAFGLITVGT